MSAINVNSITGRTGTHGPVLTGVTTVTGGTLNTAALNVTGAASFSGNVSIAGTLSYEDVTDIDSVGIITAQSGIHVTGGVQVGTGATITGSTNIITASTNGSERVRIDSSGLIANNGRVPSSYGSPNLLISGTDSTLTLMGDGSTNVSSFTGIKFRVAGLSAGDYTKAGIFAQRQAGYNDLDLIFALNTDANANSVAISDEKLRITSDGLVGVGTGTPTQILELRTGEPRLCLNGTIAGSDKGIEFEHNGTRQGHLFHNPTSGEMSLSVGENTGGAHYLAFKAGNGTEKMRITSNGDVNNLGNVGVQTSYPTSAS